MNSSPRLAISAESTRCPVCASYSKHTLGYAFGVIGGRGVPPVGFLRWRGKVGPAQPPLLRTTTTVPGVRIPLAPPASSCELTRWPLQRPIFFRFPRVLPKACEPQRLHKPPKCVSEALPSLFDRTRTFWVRMEIIKSFQAFRNLTDRTFRGRSLGYQDELEPEVDVAERSKAWRMPRTVPWSAARAHQPCVNRCATSRSSGNSNHVWYGPIATEWRVTTN
jgi:hypothetical protein